MLAILGMPGTANSDPFPEISGTLTNTCADNQDPVGIWVELYDADTNVGMGSVTTGAGGVYTFTGKAPGRYRVQPFAPALCGSVPPNRIVDTTSGTPVSGVDFAMVKVFSIDGFVTGCPADAGSPTEDVTVNLRDNTNTVIATTTTNPNGWYFFQWKPAQPGYVVEVVPAEGCTGDPLTQTVDLSTGDVSNVDFALTPESSGSLGSIGASLENVFGSVSGSIEHVFGSLGSSGSSGS